MSTKTCAICKTTINVNDKNDEDALRELKTNFGDVGQEHCVVVCDVCYEKVRPDKNPKQFAEYKAEKN